MFRPPYRAVEGMLPSEGLEWRSSTRKLTVKIYSDGSLVAGMVSVHRSTAPPKRARVENDPGPCIGYRPQELRESIDSADDSLLASAGTGKCGQPAAR